MEIQFYIFFQSNRFNSFCLFGHHQGLATTRQVIFSQGFFWGMDIASSGRCLGKKLFLGTTTTLLIWFILLNKFVRTKMRPKEKEKNS